MRKIATLTALTCLVAGTANADWMVNNDASRLSFVSTKAGAVAEVHTFKELTGRIGTNGHVDITIHLASVDTMIPLRDERMREMLFETASFPTASVLATLDMAAIDAIAPGTSRVMTVSAQLKLHGTTLDLPLELVVAKLSRTRMLVTTLKPVIVNAGQVGLEAGVEELRNVAGLPSISPAVPVSLVLGLDSTS